MGRYRLKVGDVFSIPIDEERVGMGQVVATYGRDAYYFAIYDVTASTLKPADLNQVDRARIIFLALSMDAKFAAGHWAVLGVRPVREGMPLPAYKQTADYPGDYEVVDYSGARRRGAVSAEVEFLSYRKVVAPVRLERALRAKHGLEPWLDIYLDLAPDEVNTTKRLFGG